MQLVHEIATITGCEALAHGLEIQESGTVSRPTQAQPALADPAVVKSQLFIANRVCAGQIALGLRVHNREHCSDATLFSPNSSLRALDGKRTAGSPP
jgi:hypothetical protein